jgi:hypothetical protein
MYRTLQDWRNVCNGMLISDTGGYQDQPQVVVNADGRSEHSTGISPVFPHSTSHFLRFMCGLILARVWMDGSWSCVFTLNSAHEGQDSQRVVSTVSTDEGQHWTPIVDVEPHVAPPGKTPKSTGWINNLLQPSTGHQLAVYTYNCDNVTTSPITGNRLPNANLLGCWVYRQSTDSGLSWSHTRYNLSGVYKKYDIDYSNEWGGAVLEGWSIGKPLLADDNKTVMMQYVSAVLLLPVLPSLI